MDARLKISCLEPLLLQLQRTQLWSLVTVQDGCLALLSGSVWLTQGGDDIIVHAPARHCLKAGQRAVIEALTEDVSFRLLGQEGPWCQAQPSRPLPARAGCGGGGAGLQYA